MDGGQGHRPVLQTELLKLLAPAGRRVLVDCTVGLGGHAGMLLEAAGPQASLIGMDVDEANLIAAREALRRHGGRVRLFKANFAEIEAVLSAADLNEADLVAADLGVSSNQLADGAKGLSFAVDGPLDMRLDERIRRTAADLINTMGERELADMIYENSQERYSRRIARAIVAARSRRRIERTLDLANIVCKAYPRGTRRTRRGVHPATRTFQAVRIAVNGEMESLRRLLGALPKVLAREGRAAVISFHSLEDRGVKQAFAAWVQSGGARLVNAKAVGPTPEEAADNPRSRSAKLRVIQRVG